MKNILIFLILIAFWSCDINHKKLLLINKTCTTIHYLLLVDTVLNTEWQLNDVLPHDSVQPNFVMGGKGAWEYKINNSSSDSTLHIFIFKSDKITDDVIKNQQYNRFDFRVKDLEAQRWTFTYEL